VAVATLVLDGGCVAILLDELEAVGELDGELPQAATHSDTPHTKISLYFTVPRPSYGWQTVSRQLWAIPEGPHSGCTHAALTLTVNVNSVQQEVQQRERTTARMHGRRHHELAAEVGQVSHAPVVRIEGRP
jgi:hypothetical protein